MPDINAQIMRQPQPGYQRVMFSGVEITALSDGTMGLGSDTLTGAPISIIEDYLRQAHVTEVHLTTSVNIFLINKNVEILRVSLVLGSYCPILSANQCLDIRQVIVASFWMLMARNFCFGVTLCILKKFNFRHHTSTPSLT
ncbi:hypothetical protein [Rahnella sp. PCH160]|uniref:hypothetical protein n=1 Tax=Rahnella sp. PCH160 TaxID=3447928 RepID=UPI0039FC56A0